MPPREVTIDFHCHLDLYRNPRSVAEEANARKVAVLSVTTTPSAFRGTSALAGGLPFIRTALGLHPELASEREHELPLFARLLDGTRFVGEVGLDGNSRFASSRLAQQRVFEYVLKECADAGGRIISVHSRQAAGKVIDSIAKAGPIGAPVLHWFMGSLNQAETALAAGCWFSVSAAMLRSEKGRTLVGHLPPERLLTETDGPFTSAGTHAAHPWDVREATLGLSQLWGRPEADVGQQLQSNLSTLLSSVLPDSAI